MSDLALGGRNRWIVAAGGAIVVAATLAVLFRVPAPSILLPTQPPRTATAPAVRMARPDDADLLLKQEAELRDLRPLFLPTERNAALAEPRLEPGRTFLENENLKLTFSDAEVQVAKDLPPVATLNGKPTESAAPVDAFATDAAGTSLLGFGRAKAEVAPFESRGGCIEVTAAEDGRHVLSAVLPIELRPPGGKPWTPLEFMAFVDAAGLASPLVVTEGSRVDEVDVYFRNFLARQFRIGERLPPGFYRITVAP
jgi:hypothetical protein